MTLYSKVFFSLFQVALFGHGIYFSTDLNVSLTYSRTGCARDESLLGDIMSCVVVSEIIDHEDVKLQCDGS